MEVWKFSHACTHKVVALSKSVEEFFCSVQRSITKHKSPAPYNTTLAREINRTNLHVLQQTCFWSHNVVIVRGVCVRKYKVLFLRMHGTMLRLQTCRMWCLTFTHLFHSLSRVLETYWFNYRCPRSVACAWNCRKRTFFVLLKTNLPRNFYFIHFSFKIKLRIFYLTAK